MTATIVQMSTSPSVNDIPGQLRQMAEMIERGDVKATAALFIVPVDGSYPDVYGWGEHLGDYGNIGLLELAKALFVDNRTSR